MTDVAYYDGVDLILARLNARRKAKNRPGPEFRNNYQLLKQYHRTGAITVRQAASLVLRRERTDRAEMEAAKAKPVPQRQLPERTYVLRCPNDAPPAPALETNRIRRRPRGHHAALIALAACAGW
jgi:hypothetical protein